MSFNIREALRLSLISLRGSRKKVEDEKSMTYSNKTVIDAEGEDDRRAV